MSDTLEVTYMRWDQRGAPQISGTAGCLIAALDAFLINGWGEVTATSVTVIGGVASAILPANSAFEEETVIQISGATPSELNGRARVLPGASSTLVEWLTTAADGDATGTITIKYAPQGSWEKPYSGTNKAVYRSTDITGTRMYFRIDDSGTTTCRVRGYETMSDIDTGTNPFPNDIQISGGGYWHKSSVANANINAYAFVADNKKFYIAIFPYYNASTSTTSVLRGFGDDIALSNTDLYNCSINITKNEYMYGSENAGYNFQASTETSAGGTYFVKNYTGISNSQYSMMYTYSNGNSSAISGGDPTMGTFPSAVDGELKLSKKFITTMATTIDLTPRCNLPGYYHIPQNGLVNFVNNFSYIKETSSAKKYIALSHYSSGQQNQSANGIYLIDIIGPWR